MIPYGRQDINQKDIDAVVEALKSDFLTQGPVVPKFEKAVADYCKVKHAFALNSATSALHLGCLALEVGPGDIVWTSPITFVASANCALYCGAKVDFVDIDGETFNMSVSALTKKLEQAEKFKTLPKVIIPVHFGGASCDMEAIHKLSKKYGFKIIEDASHAIGSKYKGLPVGNCQYSDITIFSFHPVKIVTTAEGGMALTNDTKLAESISLLRSHGITRNPAEMTHKPDGPWYYQQIELGFNYRMTELQAALGLSQIIRLEEFVQKRNQIVAYYQKNLKGPFKAQVVPVDCYSAYHLYVITFDLSKIIKSRLNIFEELREMGIGVNLHYIPVYQQPYYLKNVPVSVEEYPQSEAYYSSCITLPLYPLMTEADMSKVVESVLKVCKT
jgi:UDP-4-amino-4,6-dideoxy-N-acetyl-beta-L-altrosamine transaminase